MILLCGIPSETPLALVRERLDQRGTPYVLFSQRRFALTEMSFEVSGGVVSGDLRIDGHCHRLEDFCGVYTRLMDDQQLPELRGQPNGSPLRRQARALHDTLLRWYEIAPARVVNRTAPMGSNFSKPYQAQRIVEHGFRTPETLITNDPELVREFHARHGKLIYKSMSGVRSIVQTLSEEDLARLDRIRWCPVQFQAFVEGRNVRVHTVGGQVFATAITTPAIDYRYAHRQVGDHAVLEAVELSEEWSERCLRLARALDLPFAGIDLKITPDDEVYCLEVNPSPAYSFYESHTGQPISEALARYLEGC
jgi:glutathione synthase/RimK-type ligase-like ATP-grasp enzyme